MLLISMQRPLLCWQCFRKLLKIVKMLINHGAEIDLYYGFNSETALNYAAKTNVRGNFEIVDSKKELM